VQPISLIHATSYLPDTVISNDFFSSATDDNHHSMFKGTVTRRHIRNDESAASMISEAAATLIEQLNLNASNDIDILLTNVSLPDVAFTGCGAQVAGNIGAHPRWVIDVHNGGCVSFIHMMDIAQSLMAGSGAKTAMICNAQTAAGRIFNHPKNRALPQSAVPGDGAGVAYLVANNSSPVLSLQYRCHSQYASDMKLVSNNQDRWWEPHTQPLNIEFSESKIASIVERGNRLVPKALYHVVDEAGLALSQIDRLITNQPNAIFLRNWRESICMDDEAKHIHTFPEYGNLFGAAFPIALDRGIADKRLKKGHRLLLGGFSHAGDYTAAAVVDWHCGR
jgi:3-oxoacyl-[acyl-carrier-protein] synthase III